jgi:hypothetical protein
MTMTSEESIEFCISKCGCGYCPAMTKNQGYPCLEFICAFCKTESPENCAFCKGK